MLAQLVVALFRWLAIVLAVFGAIISAVSLALRARRRAAARDKDKYPTIAFFHPYCNDGGGGERVLWCGIAELCRRDPGLRVAVYTGDVGVTPSAIRKHCEDRFGIELPEIRFVYLHWRHWVEASRYPILTLFGQSFGSVILACEALIRYAPPIFVDTTGYAFTFPVARWLAGSVVGCYVHYPTISTDMLEAVASRTASFNNDASIAQSAARSNLKLMYYKIFSWVYGFVGRRADVVMVNSSWTGNHIRQIWGIQPIRVYPPCNTMEFQALPIDGPAGGRKPIILSIAQFRPEKDHAQQLHATKVLLDRVPSLRGKIEIVLAGAVRHASDQGRLDRLKELANELGIADSVRFEINVSFSQLKKLACEASVGIHTMTNEHFGIGVVEMMAAGMATVGHDSGGPKEDILVNWEGKPTGMRAKTPEGYADCLAKLLDPARSSMKLRDQIAANGRASVSTRFSDETFGAAFAAALVPLLNP